MRRALALLGLAGALSGCAVGPNYHRPADVPDAGGAFVSTPSAGGASTEPPDDWWALYADPTLDVLIRQALVANTDLRVAQANLSRARAALGEARAGFFPTTSLNGAATYGRSSSAESGAGLASEARAAIADIPGSNPSVFGPTSAHADWAFETGYDVSYQVDLFGRVRRTVEAARADAQSVEAARDAVRITVVSDVVRAYVDGCAYAEELSVAERNLKLVQSDYDLTTLQFNAGTLSQLEQARAQTTLEQARAAVPSLVGNRQANLFALAALLGVAPKDAPKAALNCTSPPKLSDPLPVGDGMALLRRRPDVREAERVLASDTARIGIVTADLYPTVTLGASIQAAAPQGASLFGYNQVSYGLGPGISWNFPNILATLARIRESKATTEGALASFDGAMLTALKETEQALATYGAELEHNAALRRARDAAQTAYTLVSQRYHAGTISQLDLLSAEQTLVQTDQTLALSDQAVADDQVVVFKALGGGWRDAPKPKL